MIEEGEKTPIAQRLGTLIDFFCQGNKSEFGRRTGIQTGVIAGYLGGRMNNPSFDALQKILAAFPMVSPDWLLAGEGEMMRQGQALSVVETQPFRWESADGAKLRDLRMRAGYSLQKLADIAGLKQSSLVAIEAGAVTPRPEHLARLSKALRIGVADILPSVSIEESQRKHIEQIQEFQKKLLEVVEKQAVSVAPWKAWGQRLSNMRLHIPLTLREAADLVAISESELAAIETGERAPSPTLLNKLAAGYRIPVERLLDDPESAQLHAPSELEVELTGLVVPISKYQGVPMVTVDSDNRDNISLVSSKAAASYPTRLLEPEYFRDLPAFSIPLPQFKNATFRAFEIIGDSMSPTFYPGGWVVARFVDMEREKIQEGYIHVVVTHEALVVKRVIDRVEQRGKLALQSDNEEFQTYEVPIEDVQEVWRVVADIGFKFPNVRFDTRRRLSGLEADLQNIMARIEKAGL